MLEAAARERNGRRPPPFQPGRGTDALLPPARHHPRRGRGGAQQRKPARRSSPCTGGQAGAGPLAPPPELPLQLLWDRGDLDEVERAAAQLATRLDELCYVWDAVRELDRVRLPGEPAPRLRAAELMLLAAGGRVHLPLGGLLAAATEMLARRGQRDLLIERLHAWYRSGG
ncbi:MAG: hypothetical protein KatS3mg102_2849 [Planctomycetota bacterium]|nr:MAG: hypothetical protein KatS3mg102_2849 [Planctomycetota bacterium]